MGFLLYSIIRGFIIEKDIYILRGGGAGYVYKLPKIYWLYSVSIIISDPKILCCPFTYPISSFPAKIEYNCIILVFLSNYCICYSDSFS